MASLDHQVGGILQRDPFFWFFDGNVVLLGHGGTAFKVHKGVLALHSEVFHDMFAHPIPGPSQDEAADRIIEGCPVIPVDDTPYDIAQLLYVMYGRNQLSSTDEVLYPVLAALLRVGDKYGVHAVVQKCVWYFLSMFPVTLDMWEVAQDYRRRIGFQDHNAIETLNVLHRVDSCMRWPYPPPDPPHAYPDLRSLDSPLAIAFFLCAQLDEEVLRRGATRIDGTPEKLSDADVERVIRMQGKLRRRGTRIIHQAYAFAVDPERCERSSSYVDPWRDTYADPDLDLDSDDDEDARDRDYDAAECEDAYEEYFVGRVPDEVEDVYLGGDPFDLWLRTRMIEVEDEEHVCGSCMEEMRDKHDELRRKFWNELPVLAGMANQA